VKTLRFDRLTPINKAWVTMHHSPLYTHQWTSSQIRAWAREENGYDIEPKSLAKHLRLVQKAWKETGEARVARENYVPPSTTRKSSTPRRRTRRGSRANRKRALARAAREVQSQGNFAPPKNKRDWRKRVMREIVVRMGQGRFREDLLVAYDRRCAITKCDLPEALEAAHILPHRGRMYDHVQNGILMRGDIHSLFDMDMIAIHPKTFRILISPELVGTAYEHLKKAKFKKPKNSEHRPTPDALLERAKEAGFLRM
jgi:hypothetical protein